MQLDIPSAIIAGGISLVVSASITLTGMWGTQKVIINRLDNVETAVKRIDTRTDQIFRDLYQPRIKDDH